MTSDLGPFFMYVLLFVYLLGRNVLSNIDIFFTGFVYPLAEL